MRKGLVLEGGALRGLFTAGVIDIFMENGIKFDGAIGVSAGACFGCNYKSNQPRRTYRYNMKYCRDWRYCSFRSLLKTGDMFGKQFCYHDIPEKLDVFDREAFINSPMQFYVTATDIETGKPVYHLLTDGGKEDLEWIRASASMPLAATTVEIDGMKLLDGGISDSIPLEYFQNIGYEKNVVILTQPDGYIKKPNKMLPLIKRSYKNYPKLVDALKNRHNVYNNNIGYIKNQRNAGNTYIICPEEALPIGRISHDPEKIKEVYFLGRQAGKMHLKKVKKFLET